ncbi:MAG TPA: hypothetical protein VLT36_14910 [Candidatus Dormibacteraeota bacterium]|nr:hypothetical protein [Candidatus Dormibacteraeota bacterium]
MAENGRPLSLLVRLRQRSVVLPWALFLFAEGTETELRAVFHTHAMTVQGAGLGELLSAFGQQTVVELVEPDRIVKFSVAAGPCITALVLTENP